MIYASTTTGMSQDRLLWSEHAMGSSLLGSYLFPGVVQLRHGRKVPLFYGLSPPQRDVCVQSSTSPLDFHLRVFFESHKLVHRFDDPLLILP